MRQESLFGSPPREEYKLRNSEARALHGNDSAIDGIEGPARPEVIEWHIKEKIRFDKQQSEFSARYKAGLVPRREATFGQPTQIAAQSEPTVAARQERRILVRA